MIHIRSNQRSKTQRKSISKRQHERLIRLEAKQAHVKSNPTGAPSNGLSPNSLFSFGSRRRFSFDDVRHNRIVHILQAVLSQKCGSLNDATMKVMGSAPDSIPSHPRDSSVPFSSSSSNVSMIEKITALDDRTRIPFASQHANGMHRKVTHVRTSREQNANGMKMNKQQTNHKQQHEHKQQQQLHNNPKESEQVVEEEEEEEEEEEVEIDSEVIEECREQEPHELLMSKLAIRVPRSPTDSGSSGSDSSSTASTRSINSSQNSSSREEGEDGEEGEEAEEEEEEEEAELDVEMEDEEEFEEADEEDNGTDSRIQSSSRSILCSSFSPSHPFTALQILRPSFPSSSTVCPSCMQATRKSEDSINSEEEEEQEKEEDKWKMDPDMLQLEEIQSEKELETSLSHFHPAVESDQDECVSEMSSMSICSSSSHPRSWWSVLFAMMKISDGRDKLFKVLQYGSRFLHLICGSLFRLFSRFSFLRRPFLLLSRLSPQTFSLLSHLVRRSDSTLTLLAKLAGKVRQVYRLGDWLTNLNEIKETYREWEGNKKSLLLLVDLINIVLGLITDAFDDIELMSEHRLFFSDEVGEKCGGIASVLWLVTVCIDIPLTAMAVWQLYRQKKQQQIEMQPQIKTNEKGNQKAEEGEEEEEEEEEQEEEISNKTMWSEGLSLLQYFGDFSVSLNYVLESRDSKLMSPTLVQGSGLLSGIIALYKLSQYQSLHHAR